MSKKRRKVLCEVQPETTEQIVCDKQQRLQKVVAKQKQKQKQSQHQKASRQLQKINKTTLEAASSEKNSKDELWKIQAFRCLLALITSAIYLNSLKCGFVYDDRRAILENRNVVASSGKSGFLDDWLWRPFSDDFWGSPMSHAGSHKSWRPLVTLTYKLQAQLWGGQPLEAGDHQGGSWWSPAASFHLVNLLLHLLVVDQVFQLTSRFTQAVAGRGQVDVSLATHSGRLKSVAVTSSLLFACHPVHVEAVTSLVGRAELMGALFALLSFARALSYIRPTSSSSSADSGRHLCLSTMCACLACLSKENSGFAVILINLWLALWHFLKKAGRNGGCGDAAAAATTRTKTETKTSGELRLALAMLAVMFAIIAVRIQLDGASSASVVVEDEPPGGGGSQQRRLLKLPNFSHLDNPLAQSGRQFCLRNLNELDDDGSDTAQRGEAACELAEVIGKLEQWRLLTRLCLPLQAARLLLWPRELSYDWPLAATGGLVKGFGDTRLLLVAALLAGLALFALAWLRQLLLPLGAPRVVASPAASGAIAAANNQEEEEEDSDSTASDETGSVRSMRSSDSGFVDSCPSSGGQLAADQPPPGEANGPQRSLERTREEGGAPLDAWGWPLVWLLAPYLPASNLLVPVGFLVAERALYLPSLGLCWLAGLAVRQLAEAIRGRSLLQAEKSGAKSGGRRRRAHNDITAELALILPLLILGAIKSLGRNSDWLSDRSLYASNLAHSPAKSMANLASLAPARGGHEQLRLYRGALEREPHSPELHYNLALALHERLKGQTDGGQQRIDEEVEYHYRTAMSLRENFALAALNLAAYQWDVAAQLEAAWRTLEQCAWRMGPGRHARQPNRHVRVQIECLIGGLRMRLQLGDANQLNAAEAAKQTGGCPRDLLRWIERARQLGASLDQAVEPPTEFGDLARQMAEIHWIWARCEASDKDKVGAILARAAEFALASQVSLAATIYTERADWLAARHGRHEARRLIERALAKEAGLRLVDEATLARLQAHLAPLLDDKDAAWRAMEEALRLAPSSRALATKAARLAHQLGRLEQSERLYLRALLLMEATRGSDKRADYNKGLASARANYGAILQVRGRLSEARHQYRRALELDPRNESARRNLLALDGRLVDR